MNYTKQIITNTKFIKGVALDLRVTVNNKNVESETWRVNGEPAKAGWHKTQRAAVAARTAA